MTDEVLARSAASPRRPGWFAAGGIIGALLASSCCVAPLALLLLGVSGAWIGNLTALEPFKPYFAAVALAFIGVGFWHVYFRAPVACAPGAPRQAAESRYHCHAPPVPTRHSRLWRR